MKNVQNSTATGYGGVLALWLAVFGADVGWTEIKNTAIALSVQEWISLIGGAILFFRSIFFVNDDNENSNVRKENFDKKDEVKVL